ncbi:MAG: hypothetical protein ABIP75_18285, partial [Pyrinomonadaceae bacterium]
AALPLLSGCNWASLARPSASGDVLDRIKKNANTTDASWSGAKDAPANVSWRTSLASESEAGERMIISGTVFQPDGRTPAPNTLIYLYHTDIHGHYGVKGEHRHGRFRGWMLTDENGRYEFSSIRPESYPDTTIAAHVHMTVTTSDLREDWLDSILFEGDKFIQPRERELAGKKGGFDPIVRLASDANKIGRAVRDIQLWKV